MKPNQVLLEDAHYDVVVILVTYNRPKLLAEALLALNHQTSAASLVIVVDNASDLETQELLSSAAGIEVLRSDVNLGGAGGFALGMQHALDIGAQWMWLMDDDAIPDVHALEILQSRINTVPGHIGALCSSVMESGAIALVHRRHFDPILGIERVVSSCAYGSKAHRVDTASFVGFLVSAVAVRSVGLPNAAFFLSYDDTEYSLRLGRGGFDIWLVPQSVIVHKRPHISRLRFTEFGPKHYFNIRNRIFVKRRYCRAGFVGALNGALLGLALWLRSPRRFGLCACRTLLRAVTDGFAGRLGPFPDSLKPAPPHA
ncbi:MAG: putative b-glycosyltransferase, Glycosyltransferase Family 2 [Polaromonas sp.]|nr:putative b-glycosyltransferase, Glycosyltransferase Family 2 [Polaromonas sp.]